MSFQQDIFNTIKALTGNKNLIAIPREFIRFTGSLDCAVLLSQLIFWNDRGSLSDRWIAKTYKHWYRETSLSEYQIRKARLTLEKRGLIETKIKKWAGNPTVHYRLNVELFVETFTAFLRDRE